jgi:polysaccharide biosynthesis protein PslH
MAAVVSLFFLAPLQRVSSVANIWQRARARQGPFFPYIRGANLIEVRFLQITKKFPWPVKDGEVMAVHNLTRGFAALGHEVTVLALNTQKHYFNPAQLPEDVKKLARFIAVDIDTTIKPVPALLNLFTRQSYNIERFYSPALEAEIAALLDKEPFDLIFLEGIYLMRYINAIRKHTTTKIVLRLHNVEYMIWQRLHDAETNPFKKIYLGILAQRMKRFELAHINQADLAMMLTAADENIFVQQGCIIPHGSFPIGYDVDGVAAIPENEETAIAFIGGMDWIPNREGIAWFIEKVWPLIREQWPAARFYLAGRNFPDGLKKRVAPGMVVLGEVEDARAFMVSKPVFIVPLFAGSGMRAKIIEAMALGRAIVSTPVGAEGIEYTDGQNILIADKPGTFAAAVVKILQQKQLRLTLGHNARQLATLKYNNLAITRNMIDFCKPFLH